MSEATTKKKLGVTTILSTLFIVATLVLGFYSVMLIQFGEVRTNSPHQEYEEVPPWEYDINWAGGQSNFFDNINYTDLPLDQELPEDLLEHLEDVLFVVEPEDPPQLWRSSAYDEYDGSSWSKTQTNEYSDSQVLISSAEAALQGNEIYTIHINATVGPSVGAIELPALFPEIQIIEDSFYSSPAGRILSYDLTTDDYNTVRLWPLLQGETGDIILINYDVTYSGQDLTSVAALALDGSAAPLGISSLYSNLNFQLTTRVTDEIDFFRGTGNNAYETAMAVDFYFRNTYELMIDNDSIMERPPSGQEITDWFIERGGGLPMDFATAYCVFMRDLGIPARMTTGYALGDAENGYRVIRVRHMMFWAEVYIPMQGGGGEWIQVLPLPLPGDMGGGELPENLGDSVVDLFVWSNDFWKEIGQDFNIQAILRIDGNWINTPEEIVFHDVTDDVPIGTATIDTFVANITYQFPNISSVGVHNITATWTSNTTQVSNTTWVVAVGTASPLKNPSNKITSSFVLSETIDVDIKQALDNYTTSWDDTIDVHGVLTVGGNPIDGTLLDNDQMLILWDDIWYGNATIQSDGSYHLDIYVDPSDWFRMITGTHTIHAAYLGEYVPDTGFPIILPGFSAHSIVELRGVPGFTLTVTPTSTYRGGNITYDGIAQYLNGTLLVGETIGIILNGSIVGTAITNGTGGFNYEHTIPGGYPSGTAYAQVNWTSSYSLIDGNTNVPIAINIQFGSTSLTIDSSPNNPDPVHIFEDITIFGYLTDASNGSGLVGRSVDIWWNTTGIPVLLGSNTTIAAGYYEYTYNVPSGYEGIATYWSEYVSAEPTYQGSTSGIMNITIKPYDVAIFIEVLQNPIHIGEELDIQGAIYLPEFFPSYAPLSNAHLTLWWTNNTGTYNITGVYATLMGVYIFNYTIPLAHDFTTVQLWAEYTSSSPAFSSNFSQSIDLVVTNYVSQITVQSNVTVCHLDQSVFIYGYLDLDNGTPLIGYDVDIEWNNGTLYNFTVITNSTGWYEFYYNFSIATDSPGTASVTVYHTSLNPVYNSSSATLAPSITIQLYQITLNGIANPTPSVHLDEVLSFSGTLIFDDGPAPIVGETIIVFYKNNTGTYAFPKITDGTGGFSFLYNYSLSDALGAIYVWAEYISGNPLWENAESLNRTANVILYSMTLTTLTDNSSYHLDEVVHVWGFLTFSHNGTPLSGQSIRIYWNNGTEYTFEWYTTDGSGQFDFYYNITLATDSTGSVDVWATFTNVVTLWENASSSPGETIGLQIYSLSLTTVTDSASYFLDEVVHVWGFLTFTNNGTPLSGQSIRVYWNNGTEFTFEWYTTDGAGQFDFYYNLSSDTDDTGSVDIWVEFTSSNPLWENATSSPGTSITLGLYVVNLDIISITPNPVYLNETVTITARLYFGNGTDLANKIIWFWWDNGSVYLLQSITNTSGFYTIQYSNMDYDSVWTGIQIFCNYSGSPLIQSVESAHPPLTLQQWITTISGFDTGGSTTYNLADTVPITGSLNYVDGPTQYGGVLVEFFVEGSLVYTNNTASDGSFTGYWYIDGLTPTGDYDVIVRFNSSVYWIASTITAPITITVAAQDIIWTFVVTPSTTAYLGESLNITVILTLSNGSAYSGALVEFNWANIVASLSSIPFSSDMTDVNGRIQFWFMVDITHPLGDTDFWAYCESDIPTIAASSSAVITVNIQQIPVNIAALADVTVLYLDETITITGTLTFGNGSGMYGYQVQL
ncbi:MAG: transglutaminase-like domain-containing protein, partial [Candidatus Thorarchaeota archaeon]